MLFFRMAAQLAFCGACLLCGAIALGADYVVVVSQATQSDAEWSKVVQELVAKHHAEVIVYDKHISESLPALRKTFPRYTCFVATSEEASAQMVADVHRLTRKLDDDPYADVFWGILTGYDAANALAIAKEREPLVIKRVASGTELAMDRVSEGVWYCELEQNRMVRKFPGSEASQSEGPSDTTQALAATLTEYQADLFVTSGHATERNWQIGFRFRNGEFQSMAGQLFGVDTMGNKIPIVSANPKVYLPIGNCLMGHIDGPDAMALAFMNSAGVRQMMGYTVPTWYGYGGWGCLDYFVEQPGRYTLVEAFFANQHALIDRLETNFPEIARLDTTPGSQRPIEFTLSDAAKKAGLSDNDGIGLLHDRDVVALYGDPAWNAKLAPGKLSYEQTLTEVAAGVFALEIKPLLAEKSFEPVNQNGSERGWRPFVHFFPNRLQDIEVIAGKELEPVVAILVRSGWRLSDGRFAFGVHTVAEVLAIGFFAISLHQGPLAQWLFSVALWSDWESAHIWLTKGAASLPASMGLLWVLTTSRGPCATLLSQPLPVYLGKISYAFFLVHSIVLTQIVRHTPEHLSTTVGILSGLFISVAIAAVLNLVVELPCRNLIVALLDRSPRSPLRRSFTAPPLSETIYPALLTVGVALLGFWSLVMDSHREPARHRSETRQITFEACAILHYVGVEHTNEALILTLVWEKYPQCDAVRIAHILQPDGTFMHFPSNHALFNDGRIGIEKLVIPRGRLQGAVGVAVGLFSDGQLVQHVNHQRTLRGGRLIIYDCLTEAIPDDVLRSTKRLKTIQKTVTNSSVFPPFTGFEPSRLFSSNSPSPGAFHSGPWLLNRSCQESGSSAPSEPRSLSPGTPI